MPYDSEGNWQPGYDANGNWQDTPDQTASTGPGVDVSTGVTATPGETSGAIAAEESQSLGQPSNAAITTAGYTAPGAYQPTTTTPTTTTPAPTTPSNPYDINFNFPTPNNSDLGSYLNSLIGMQQQEFAYEQEQQAQRDQYAAQVRQQIDTELNKAEQPVTPQDPVIAESTNAADYNNQRALQQDTERMAARGAAGYGPTSGASAAALQSGEENLGIARTNTEVGLMQQEVQARRAEVQNLLDTEAGVMTADEQASLQQELGNLNATDQMLTLQTQTGTGLRSQDIQTLLGLGGLSNQFTGLTNQNAQFYDQLGLTAGNDAAMYNYLYNQLAG